MKKIFTSLLILSAISAQAQTVKKVVLEDFTGAWCQWCPEGTGVTEDLTKNKPNNFIAVAAHSGDDLEVTDGAGLVTALGVSAYPNGAIDRFKNAGATGISQGRDKWPAAVNARIAAGAIASVSIANLQVSGNTFSGDIKVNFTSSPNGTPLKVNLLILDDSIPAVGSLEQINAGMSSYQPGNNPLVNFYHNDVLRDAAMGLWGKNTNMPANPALGVDYIEPFVFIKNPLWKKANLKLVAFVAYDGTVSANQKEILNAERVSLRYAAPLGVNDVVTNSLQATVHPNPAMRTSNVLTSFTLQQDATVTMQVINHMGQIVAQPYTSWEIAGAHSIQWTPSQYGNLAAGIYSVKLSTDKGDNFITKLAIQ